MFTSKQGGSRGETTRKRKGIMYIGLGTVVLIVIIIVVILALRRGL
jgi:hypothetical protein